MAHVSFDGLESRPKVSVLHGGKVVCGIGNRKTDLLLGGKSSRERVVSELKTYFGKVKNFGAVGLSWSDSVAERWGGLNKAKSRDELGLLSWNVNGRLKLRGCRESLLRRWASRFRGCWPNTGALQKGRCSYVRYVWS